MHADCKVRGVAPVARLNEHCGAGSRDHAAPPKPLGATRVQLRQQRGESQGRGIGDGSEARGGKQKTLGDDKVVDI